MATGDERICNIVRSFLVRQQIIESENDEQYSTKFNVRSTSQKANITVFNSGKMVIGGKDSKLKELLESLKNAIENDGALPGQLLPFEIDKFPETILEKVQSCDPVIVRFIQESINCYKGGSTLGAAFMLGAASEKAINLLIYTYAESIADEVNKNRFISKVNNRMISVKYNEFKKSYNGCKSRPSDRFYVKI